MKWLATTFLCLLTTSAYAQEIPPGVITLPSVLVCGEYDPDNNEKLREEFGEIPFLEGKGQILTPDVSLAYHGKIRMFMNPETTSWTLMIDIEERLTCMVTTGDYSGPASSSDDNI